MIGHAAGHAQRRLDDVQPAHVVAHSPPAGELARPAQPKWHPAEKIGVERQHHFRRRKVVLRLERAPERNTRTRKRAPGGERRMKRELHAWMALFDPRNPRGGKRRPRWLENDSQPLAAISPL